MINSCRNRQTVTVNNFYAKSPFTLIKCDNVKLISNVDEIDTKFKVFDVVFKFAFAIGKRGRALSPFFILNVFFFILPSTTLLIS